MVVVVLLVRRRLCQREREREGESERKGSGEAGMINFRLRGEVCCFVATHTRPTSKPREAAAGRREGSNACACMHACAPPSRTVPVLYWRPKRMGSWKSSWHVPHWCLRLSASVSYKGTHACNRTQIACMHADASGNVCIWHAQASTVGITRTHQDAIAGSEERKRGRDG